MTQCIKCGKEIPEGELFCIECSLNPGASMFEDAKPSERFPLPKGKMQTPVPVKYIRVQTPVPVAPPRASRKPLAIALAIVTLVLVAVLGVVAWQFHDFQAEKNRMRTKQADLDLRIAEVDAMQQQIDELTLQLEDAGSQMKEKEGQVRELKAQLNAIQSSQSQGAYDLTAKEQELEQLYVENQELLLHCEELELEIDGLEEARSTLETALEAARVYKTKAEFMDSYVVFVENDGSNCYHTYDCTAFGRSSFWAYSRKLAEAQGFHPCSVCGGTP